MNHPKYQGQHRISQIYLRQFGYFKDDNWYISVWDKTKNHTDYVLIENFSKETNLFDLPVNIDFKQKRYFENKSVIIESEYQKVINTLRRQKQLTPRHRDILCHYISNLICRGKPYRELFEDILNDDNSRETFLKEITMFDEDELPTLKTSLSNIPENAYLNYTIGHIVNYLVRVLRSFNFIILKDYEDRGWFTTDNPILIDSEEDLNELNEEYPYIIPIESEIYFPLSRDYCAFLYHSKSEKNTNLLRRLNVNKINEIDEQTHTEICLKIGSNKSDYFLFNQDMGVVLLDNKTAHNKR